MLIYIKPDQCMVCQGALQPAFYEVEDRVYGVPGKWNLDRCADNTCSVLYLAHDVTAEQLSGFYDTYSTHSPPVVTATGAKKLYREALKHIQHRHLGYPTRQSGLAAVVAGALNLVPYFRQMAESRVFWLPYVKGGRVIEVGFGNGQSLAQLRDAGWLVQGSELDETCVGLAREMGFDAVSGEFTGGLFGAASADAVVASHAIEHVPNPRAFFVEALRVLRPGGRMVLRTPNAVSTDARRAGANWRGLEVPRHLSIHSPGSLTALAQQTGFTNVAVRGTPLGGFIAQQSQELRANQTPASRQGRKTIFFNILEAARTIRDDQRSAEIYLIASKPLR